MKFLRVFLSVAVFFTVVTGVSAVTLDETNSRIEELKQKITQLESEEKSLSNQISLINTQISLTTAKVEAIRSAIDKLAGEAEQLGEEISRLEELLTRRSELVLRRIPESYKRQSASQFGMLFFSRDFGDFLARIKYITTVQTQDAQLLFQLKATQQNFSERKELREEKKLQQEELKLELELENLKLDKQKGEKQALLTQTRNSETEYRKLLAQALAEKQALERALVEGVKVGRVNRGDPIALVGNTGYPGCSTGAHLHFEVRRGGSWVDPSSFLSSKTVNDEQNGGSRTVGGGSWDWPLADTIRMTQFYGSTPYSWRYAYSGGIHTGFDMVSTSSDIIKAPEGGELYSSSQACGSSSIIKIKYIEHGDGVITFYLHVQ
jgi:peptidoglycan hydrolase CwlO-like protein